MDILFIWFGKVEPLYAWRDACIRRAFELYPEANFKCITTLKDFYGMEIIDAEEVAAKMKSEGYYSDIDNFIALSDEMRFWWLARNKNTLYLDTDIYCVDKFNTDNTPKKSCIEALWNGDNYLPFIKILETRAKGELFIDIEEKLDIEDMSECFEHKAKWGKKLRETKGRLMPLQKFRELTLN